MTSKQQGEVASRTLDECDVVAYLQENPDFFAGHPELVTDLTVPHASGDGVVSLIERQVATLRGERELLHSKLRNLAQAAKTNEQLLLRMQALFIRLIGCPDLDSALAALDESLRTEFHADQVAIRLFDAEGEDLGPILDTFDSVLRTREPVCGYLSPDQSLFLFGNGACDAASGTVVPLHDGNDGGCIGLLGVASIDPKRFHPEMGTLFLNHLGVVVGGVLRRLAR